MGWATKHMGSENRLPHPWCNPCSRIWIPHFQTHPYIIIYHIVSLYLIVSPWYSLNHRISPFLLVKSHLIQLDFLKTIENHHEIPWNPFCSCLNPNKPCVIFQTGRVEVSGCCCFWHVTAGCPSWPNEVVDCSQGRLRLLRHEAVSSWLVDGNGIIWKYMGMYIYICISVYLSLCIYMYLGNIYTGWWFGTWFLWLPYIGNAIIPTDKVIFPHIFVWGSCFWLCTSALPARLPPLARRPQLVHTQLVTTQLVTTQLVHTQLTHTQAWHLATSTFTLRGRRGTALGDIDRHFAWQAWHCTWRHRPSLCVAGVAVGVAGVALGDIDLHFAWQAWHSWHWAGSGGALGSQLTPWAPRLFAWQAWHLATSTFTLRGRRGDADTEISDDN